MINVFKNQSFYDLTDRGGKLLLQDMRFEECAFINCAISLTTQIDKMTTVRDVTLDNCSANGCQTGPMILSRVSINKLQTNDLLIVWSPYFDRVTLSGEIGKMKINKTADPSTYNKPTQQPFEDFRAKFYAGVEWALDISQARFREFDVRGVPGHLIRRDPESQILITRERARQVATPGWEARLEPSVNLWPFMINQFLSGRDHDTVLVAPLGAAKAKRDPLLKGLQELRRIGLAEPD
jgi:hypothetical protein